MRPVVIPAEKNLVGEVYENLLPSGPDYSSNLVLFPGKRPSHFLRQRIASEIKKSFIPPYILSMDSFIDTVFEECVSENKKKIETVDAVAILYQINKTAKTPLGGEEFLKPDLFFPLGIKLFNDLEELMIENVAPEKIREVDFESFEESVSVDIKARLESLSGFYESFYAHLKREGLSTRAVRYSEVSRLTEFTSLKKYERVIAAGFFALTRTETRIMKNLIKRNNTTLIFQDGPGVSDTIEALGYPGPMVDTSLNGKREPRLHFIKSPDSHGQVLALNHTLASPSMKEKLDQKTFIILPTSETLFPLVNHTLTAMGKASYNISLGFPLKRTPVYGFFSTLIELIASIDRGRVYIPHYLNFILHPYTKNIYFDKSTELTRIVFHALERKLTGERSKLFFTTEEIEQMTLSDQGDAHSDGESPDHDIIARHIKSIHKNTIGMFKEIENTGDFALKGARVIEYIYRHSTARLHPFFHPFSENFIQALKVISRSMAKSIKFESCQGYFNFVKSYLNTCHTPFEGVPLKGVQIIGFLEARSLNAERVFILDANEGVLPETGKDNSLIPFKVRQYLGLPTYSDTEKISSYYFDTITKGAKDVYFYFVENKKKEKSRFVAKLIWEEEKRSGKKITPEEGVIKSVNYSLSLEKEQIKPVSKTKEIIAFLMEFRFSATSIDTYLFCPLRFYHRYVLNITKKEDVSELIEPSKVGLFVHKVLQILMEERQGQILTEKHFLSSSIEKTADRLFDREFSSEVTGSLYILKRQIITQLKSFFKNYQVPEILSAPTTVTDVELHLESSVNGHLIKGKIDRVDRSDGKFTIIDYKSSSDPGRFRYAPEKINPDDRDTWESTVQSIQLPFYLLLYSLARKINIKFLNGKILLLGKSVIDSQIEVPLFSGTTPEEEQFIIHKRLISTLLDEITDHSLPFNPTKERKKKCEGCGYAGFCGDN